LLLWGLKGLGDFRSTTEAQSQCKGRVGKEIPALYICERKSYLYFYNGMGDLIWYRHRVNGMTLAKAKR